MKQKVVVKVNMNEKKKARSKAFKIAVSVDGVESACFQGADKDQIAVTGEGIDSVELITLLRKNVGYTELVTVGPVGEKTDNPNEAPIIVQKLAHSYYGGFPMPLQIYDYEAPRSEPSPCFIL